MKGNQVLGIGLLVLSITIIVNTVFKLPEPICLLFLLLAIILEVIAVIKMKNENKK